MAEDKGNKEEREKEERPKIKLGLQQEHADLIQPQEPGAAGKRGTTRIDVGSAKKPEPGGEENKRETSRIDLSQAQPPPPGETPPQKGTAHIKLTEAYSGPEKKGTSRIALSAAHPPPAKEGTTRIELDDAATAEQPRQEAQRGTPEDRTATPDEEAPATEPAAKDPSKASTMRIELDEEPEKPAPAEPAEQGVSDARKQPTQRIQLTEDAEEEKMRDTSRLETQALRSVSEIEKKKRTSRIELPESVESQDAEARKKRTLSLEESKLGPQQKTAETPAGKQPKTIRIKRPDTPQTKVMPRQPDASADEAAEAKKGETARLDLPPEAAPRPPTQPKTIRIKRPDGTSTRKPMTITRPAAAPKPAPSEGPGLASAVEAEEESSVGALFVLMALVAVVNILVLLYVLLGQTYVLEIPFPGRLS